MSYRLIELCPLMVVDLKKCPDLRLMIFIYVFILWPFLLCETTKGRSAIYKFVLFNASVSYEYIVTICFQ